ncbi:MAG: LapA family protein [Gammaproteobacteria bacterium]
MRRILLLVLSLLIVAIGAAFAVLNANVVDLNYYFGTREIPLSLTLVVAFAGGALLGVIASLGMVVRLKRENRRLRREATLAEKEVMNLRNLPIKDVH